MAFKSSKQLNPISTDVVQPDLMTKTEFEYNKLTTLIATFGKMGQSGLRGKSPNRRLRKQNCLHQLETVYFLIKTESLQGTKESRRKE